MPAAMLRLILPSRAGLKSLNDLQPNWGISPEELFAASAFDFDPNHTWDVATLAIGPEYRAAAFQGMITMALCQSISMLGGQVGFPWAIALLHVPVLRMLQWKLHRPFNEFAGVEPRPYLDSPASLPAWLHLPEWHRRLADRDPILFHMMTDGTGRPSWPPRSAPWPTCASISGNQSQPVPGRDRPDGRDHVVGGHRSGVQEALREVAAQLAQ
jgi:hypothetical protein